MKKIAMSEIKSFSIEWRYIEWAGEPAPIQFTRIETYNHGTMYDSRRAPDHEVTPVLTIFEELLAQRLNRTSVAGSSMTQT